MNEWEGRRVVTTVVVAMQVKPPLKRAWHFSFNFLLLVMCLGGAYPKGDRNGEKRRSQTRDCLESVSKEAP